MKRNQPMKILLSIAGIGILFIGIYQFAFASTFGNGLFFESDRSAPVKMATSTQQGSSHPITNSSSSNTALASETVFNAQTLSAYNGKNGAPAYVAVNGIVYDMTGIGAWTNGQHQGYSAGQDLTATFSNSPHSEKMLTQLPIVGTFVSSVVKVDTPLVDSKTSATITAETQVTVPAESIALSPSSTTTSSDIWTYSILSKYNGVGGQPAYIAVNGVIYNVSSIGTWTGGVHHGIKAGQDVTAFFGILTTCSIPFKHTSRRRQNRFTNHSFKQ